MTIYVATHDQLVDVARRIGSKIGSAFADGGIHSRFGTRNFTLALKNGHYYERPRESSNLYIGQREDSKRI